MNQITPAELCQKLQSQQPLQLIDVREPHEHETFNIGGVLMPLGEIFDHTAEIRTDIPVIVYCKMGIRSQIAIQRLQQKLGGYGNLYNLKGGLESWKKLATDYTD